MLDVDGHVISAAVLIQRVEALVRTIDAKEPQPRVVVQPPVRALDAPIHAMLSLVQGIRPPEFGEVRGPRAQGGLFVKRVVRKLTSWYVEPRWSLQQELNAQNIEYASMLYNEGRRVVAELDELRRQNTRIRLQLVATIERSSRYRREVEEMLGSVPSVEDVQSLESGDAQ
jgi:hypothetical protein